VAAVVVQPSATLAGPQGPELLYPPDGTSDTVIDLIWKWGRALGADEWFELQIWPDVPNPKPEVYAWLQEGRQRVTAATFMPGKYFWRVIVVKGKEEKRSAELSPFSLTWSFIITRPSTKGGLTPTCLPTCGPPCPTATISPTPTRTPWWWWQTPVVRTRTPTRTRTSTATALPQPTPTGTLLPVTPTNTSMPPTPTNTAYPQPTVPQPTATNTAYPQPTVPVPTWTPRPGLTRTATPVVTVYPPPYSSPTPQPGVTQTAYPYPPSLRR
jgi:hypothetical protein